MRSVLVAVSSLALGSLAPAGATAQTSTATPAQAFLYAVEKVCTPNVMGQLSFNSPTAALDAAHVLLERHVCIDTTASGGNAQLLSEASGT